MDITLTPPHSIYIYACYPNTINLCRSSKEVHFDFTQDNLRINTILNLISIHFECVTTNITLYDWKGIEFIEDADLYRLCDPTNAYNRVIFFINKGEVFNSQNILRLFTMDKTPLGQGGFGKVMLAHLNDNTSETFAIKFINQGDCDNNYQGLFKEINLLTRLDHPNIIRLHSYCITESNNVALIMEYASGGTLTTYIKASNSGKLNEEESKAITKQLLLTMKYCHSKDIIHRDLKPENILFEDDSYSNIKIIDFGISTLTNDSTRAGSLHYMSPEVLSGKNAASLPSIDVWSIGCIMYEMLTGNKMFKGKDREQTKDLIMERKILFPPYLSIEAVHLINLLCKYHVRERISINDALNHPWITGSLIVDSNVIQETKELYMKTYTKKTTRLTLSLSGGLKYSHNIAGCTIISSKSINSSVKKLKTTLSNRKHLITKLPSDATDDALFNYNLNMIRKFNGNVPSYMSPIGHTKNQKHSSSQFKEYFNSINKNSNSGKTKGKIYLNTNENEKKSRNVKNNKKKELELPPLQGNSACSLSARKKNVSSERFNSTTQGNFRNVGKSKCVLGKKVKVIKINL